MIKSPVERMNDFIRDDQWQRSMRNRFLAALYGKWAYEGRYVFIEKSRYSMLLQRRDAVDTLIQSRAHLSTGIEEKIERWPGSPRRNFFLETQSCTVPGREREGWMQYAQCDVLFYLFAQENTHLLDGYLIHRFDRLKRWFWQNTERYETRTLQHTLNKTRGYLVPILDVVHAVKTERYVINDAGMYVQVPLPTTLEAVLTIPTQAYRKLALEEVPV